MVKRVNQFRGRCISDISRWRDEGHHERVTILEITPEGKRTLKHMEKDEWLEVLLKGFTNEERLQLPGMVKRLIKSNVHFARGEV